jgi:hypothetical protein
MVGLPLDLIDAVHRAPGSGSIHAFVEVLRRAVDEEAVELWGDGAEAALDRALAAVDRTVRTGGPPEDLSRRLAVVVDLLAGPDVTIGPGALDRLSAAVGAPPDRRPDTNPGRGTVAGDRPGARRPGRLRR